MNSPEDIAPTARQRGLFLPGDLIAGRHRIARFVARGGMGEVYEATDVTLGRTVALKTVRPDLAADGEAMERFKREILLASRVSHPNVCRVYDIGGHEVPFGSQPMQVTFLTMEFLEGTTLEQQLRRSGPVPQDAARRLLGQIAAGLDAAHASGIVHRDFKTANVMLVPGGTPDSPRAVITDFGLARSVEDRGGGLTGTGLVVGTPAYMAPEQAQGLEATPRSDVYSFGVVAYEVLTGRLPHSGATPMAVLLEKTRTPAPSPIQHVPGLDPRWESVVLSCLQMEPTLRCSSAGDAMSLLDTSPSLPSGTTASPPRSRATLDSRRRSLLWGSVSLAVAILAVLAVLTVDALKGRKPAKGPRLRGAMQSTQVTMSAGLDLFPAFLPDGTSLVFCAETKKGYEILLRSLDGSGSERALTSDGQQNFQPSPSPRGDSIAYHSTARGGIWVLPLAGGAPRQVSDFGSAPRFSPDGTMIAFQSDALDLATATSPNFSDGSTIWVVRPDGTGLARITQAASPPGGHGAPSWTPDGKDLVFLSSTGNGSVLWSVSLAGGKLRKLFASGSRIFDPLATPDGREVLYSAVSSSGSAGIWSIPIRSEGAPATTPEQVVNLGPSRIRQIAIAPDGSRIAYGALSMTSHIHTLAVSGSNLVSDGRSTPLTSGTIRNSRPVFSPDGTRIAFTRSVTGGNEDIWVANADGSGASALTTSSATDTDPSWFPSGDRILFTSNRSGKNRLFSVSVEGGDEEPLKGPHSDVTRARLSPDGKRVAYNVTDFRGSLGVAVLDLASGASKTVTVQGESVGFPQWSMDGKTLSVQVSQGQKRVNVGLVSADASAPLPARIITFDQGLSWNGGFSPDGSKVLFAGERGGIWNLFWVSTDGREQGQLTRLSRYNAYVRYPSFSPDGKNVIFEYAETSGNIWMLQAAK